MCILVKLGNYYRSHFDGILEAVGTAGSMAVIRDKIVRRDAPAATIRSWISSLSYIPKPDEALLNNSIELLRAGVRREYPMVLLTFSNLAHSYCKDRQASCSTSYPIATLTRLYERYFNLTKCEVTRDNDIEQVVYSALKLG